MILKNKKNRSLYYYLLWVGLCWGWIIYFFIDKTYPDSVSSGVQHLNWLLSTLGKTGTSALIGLIGLVVLYVVVEKLRE